jgi:hypothetical protein
MGVMFSGFGDAGTSTSAFVAEAETVKATIAQVNDQLYAALNALRDSNTLLNFEVTTAMVDAANIAVESWHASAIRWMNQLGDLVGAVQADAGAGAVQQSTLAAFTHWTDEAAVLASTGIATAAMVKDDASHTMLKSWAEHALPSLKQSGALLVRTINNLADLPLGLAKKAAWSTATIVLTLGAGLAGAFFLLRKSGVRGSVGPVSLSSYQKRGMRHVRVVAKKRSRR